MTHVWDEHYRALYDRTYRVLCDAGIDEKLADELATQRTIAAALATQITSRFHHTQLLMHGITERLANRHRFPCAEHVTWTR